MKRRRFGGTLAALVLASAVAGTATPGDLRSRIEHLVRERGPEVEVAVAMRTLDGRAELLVSPDEVFHAASTMKVPVLIELYRAQRDGELRLSDPLPIRNEFRSIVDGSEFRLEPSADGDGEVYSRLGGSMPLGEVGEAMIVRRGNLATNLLVERLGVDRIRATSARLGAAGMRVLRGVEDTKAFEAGFSNTTTARALLALFLALARGEAVDPGSDRRMVELLSRPEHNAALPAGLPAGLRVAHKTGQITRIQHDAGIVFAERPYVLVVLVGGIDDEREGRELIAAIAREVHAETQGPAPRVSTARPAAPGGMGGEGGG
jgi:beta-lactamase class A